MKYLIGLFAVAMVLLLGCCSFEPPAEKVSILAGSELKDISPYLDEIREQTGVEIAFHFTGTLDGAEEIASGARYDMGWFSHAKYLNLLQDKSGKRYVQGSERIMLSPVVLGVKRSVGERLGWCDAKVSWADIAEKSARGEFRFAMSTPAASNSGFSVVVAAQVAFNGEALSATNVDAAQMRDFAKGHLLRAGSSGWLADLYLRRQNEVDGIFNYESVLLSLNQNPELGEPLCLVYPSEGVITADYPLLLLDESKRQAFDKLVAFLTGERFQRRVLETGRRPINAAVAVDERFPKALILEAPFPASVDIVDAILLTYLDKQLKTGHAIFLVDISGSMSGEPIIELRQALQGLTGLDRSITGQFARFREGEKVTLIPFDDQPGSPVRFAINLDDAEGQQRLRTFIESLNPDGGTAIFSALNAAYRLADELRAADPERPLTIVLMSDGRNQDGMTETDFVNQMRMQPERFAATPTFAVIFGDADEAQMERIADLTGGQAFDSRKQGLSQVFKTIRGYQ